MSVRMGKKFTELGAQVTGSAPLIVWRERVAAGATPGCYPVALAVNFAAQGLSTRDAFVVHQYGVAMVVTTLETHQPISFRNQVVASLNVGGCNQGACHGTPSGKGGFRLTLRGYDPVQDYEVLTREAGRPFIPHLRWRPWP